MHNSSRAEKKKACSTTCVQSSLIIIIICRIHYLCPVLSVALDVTPRSRRFSFLFAVGVLKFLKCTIEKYV